MTVLDEWSPPRFAGVQKPAYRPPDSKKLHSQSIPAFWGTNCFRFVPLDCRAVPPGSSRKPLSSADFRVVPLFSAVFLT